MCTPSRLAGQRSEELERRCEKLRVEQEERDYRRMTNNVRRDNEKVARMGAAGRSRGPSGRIGGFCWQN